MQLEFIRPPPRIALGTVAEGSQPLGHKKNKKKRSYVK